jgi:hypothetical protein
MTYDVKPWSKEAERMFKQMCKDGKAFTLDNGLSKSFGIKCKELIELDLLDIARTRNRKKTENRTYILPKPGIVVVPKITGKGLKFRFKPLKL